MYLHVGAGKMLLAQDIIGVFDMDGHVDSEVNRGFLKMAERGGRTVAAGEDLPRSFVVTCGGVVFSHISVAALAKRGNRFTL